MVLARIYLRYLLQIYFRLIETLTGFKSREWTMPEIAHPRGSFHLFKETDRDEQLKLVLDGLESENGRLKELIVRLSETIIRNVVGKPGLR
jgi:hypothetical protein